jgi:hypothetical protein
MLLLEAEMNWQTVLNVLILLFRSCSSVVWNGEEFFRQAILPPFLRQGRLTTRRLGAKTSLLCIAQKTVIQKKLNVPQGKSYLD